MMRPLEEVRSQVLRSMRRLGTETVPFGESMDRVLAEDVIASHDVPHFANSAMDGFAVRATDVSEPGAVLEVLEDVPAGQVASAAVGEGQAIRIMTGAPMPAGADTVVRVEDTSAEADRVTVLEAVAEGTSVRAAEATCTPGSWSSSRESG